MQRADNVLRVTICGLACRLWRLVSLLLTILSFFPPGFLKGSWAWRQGFLACILPDPHTDELAQTLEYAALKDTRACGRGGKVSCAKRSDMESATLLDSHVPHLMLRHPVRI